MAACLAPQAMAQAALPTLTPDLLTPADETAYRAGFAAAATTGDPDAVEAAMGPLRDGILRAQVERERLLSPARPADLAALSGWLERFPDQAGADAVLERAQAARDAAPDTSADVRLTRPEPVPPRRGMGGAREASFNPVPLGPGATPAIRARIDAMAQRFYGNDDAGALAIALEQAEGPQSGQAGWIGGLAAWRLGQTEQALALFTLAANWQAGDDWGRSAGAFWAARAAERLGRDGARRAWLEQAAAQPMTFYGQLALERLGRWNSLAVPTLADQTSRAARLLAGNAGVRRAVALSEIGRRDDAEAELAATWARARSEDDLGFLQIATDLRLEAVAARIAQTSPAAAVAARYPAPEAVRPRGGDFVLDRSVIFAVMRQESRFDPRAVSSAGARGLMQVMPATAAWMTGRPELRSSPALLFDVTLNVTLGEEYLERVMRMGVIDDCLIRTFMAYNAGPGSVANWNGSVGGGDDILMFLEAVPSGQARIYAERVMSNLWIYHRRLGQRAPSLERLARGMTPLYEPQDNPRMAGGGGGAVLAR